MVLTTTPANPTSKQINPKFSFAQFVKDSIISILCLQCHYGAKIRKKNEYERKKTNLSCSSLVFNAGISVDFPKDKGDALECIPFVL